MLAPACRVKPGLLEKFQATSGVKPGLYLLIFTRMIAAPLKPPGQEQNHDYQQHHAGEARRRKAKFVKSPVGQASHQKQNQYDQ
jgi:hypothetical protein